MFPFCLDLSSCLFIGVSYGYLVKHFAVRYYKMTLSAYCLKLVCFIRRSKYMYYVLIGNTFTQFFL